MKMNLPRALKLKNRLAGEMTRIQSLIQRDNSVELSCERIQETETKEAHSLAVGTLIAELDCTRSKLVRIKTEISRANVDVYEKICAMNEAKSEIAFWKLIPTRSGTFRNCDYGETVVERRFHAACDQAYVDAKLKELQARIDSLQDEVDDYNASTVVDV